MPVPSAPVISSVTLSPSTVGPGEAVAAIVAWAGYPVDGVTFQWRRGSIPISGATGPEYTPTDTWADLNCFVHIDNGRGTASSASGYALIEEPDLGPLAFSDGFSGGFQ
jgi:hypothetical protein